MIRKNAGMNTGECTKKIRLSIFELYCSRPEHLIFHRHLLRSNISLDLANLLQVSFDLRNTLERKILSPKIKASDRRQYTLDIDIKLKRLSRCPRRSKNK